ncbi:DUF7257 domain-containing protein [Rhodococcus spongiicola]|nr:PE-PPE domain-containing protein [Rhodococcus spongiicola]
MTAPTEPPEMEIHLLWIPGTGASEPGDPRNWQQVKEGYTQEGYFDENGEWVEPKVWPAQTSMGHALMNEVFDVLPEALPEYFGNLNVIPQWIGYPSSIGPVGPGDENHYDSRLEGKRKVLAELEKLPVGAKAIIGGFSQGAGAAYEFVNEVAYGQHGADVADKVVAGLYVANPFRPEGYTSWGMTKGSVTPEGFGVATYLHDGKEEFTAEVHKKIWQIEIINDNDPICNADPDALVRELAEVLEFFEFEGSLITNPLTNAGRVIDAAVNFIVDSVVTSGNIFHFIDRVGTFIEDLKKFSGLDATPDGILGIESGPTEHVHAYNDLAVRKLHILNEDTGEIEPKTILQAEMPYIGTILLNIFSGIMPEGGNLTVDGFEVAEYFNQPNKGYLDTSDRWDGFPDTGSYRTYVNDSRAFQYVGSALVVATKRASAALYRTPMNSDDMEVWSKVDEVRPTVSSDPLAPIHTELIVRSNDDQTDYVAFRVYNGGASVELVSVQDGTATVRASSTADKLVKDGDTIKITAVGQRFAAYILRTGSDDNEVMVWDDTENVSSVGSSHRRVGLGVEGYRNVAASWFSPALADWKAKSL